MSMIKISNLTFNYDAHPDYIFRDVSFSIDTNWKLGFIGRNGKGKTTFLNLLLGKYEYTGSIKSDVNFDYFPFEISDKNLTSYEIAQNHDLLYEQWKFEREISLLDITNILDRPFNTLSRGEQTKILLAILFSKENNFLLIDEPTNHLDINARISVTKYLNRKKGFILVSHDRTFLDNCIDHVLSINRATIDVVKGNFTSWYENKTRQDNFELHENEKLKKDISRLQESARKTSEWSNKVEKSKYTMAWDGAIDKGFIGSKAAKMMKRSKSTQKRMEKESEEKSKLLKNIEVMEDLKLSPLPNRKGHLIEVNNLSISYDGRKILSNINFCLDDGDRLQLKGKNGSGKSSIIKLILRKDLSYNGKIYLQSNLKISYVSQETSNLSGNLKEYIYINNIDETLFKAILRKMDFEREQFNKPIESFSEGQKKKVLLAKSICEQANIYIWDEPLNYIDIFSRMQIEKLIDKYHLTMIFVEHDETFGNKIANKILDLDKI
ncbi:MAG: ABC-F type ribosomal protection protein [Elusimicrobia bacterium]|nr:ABC-F type ribosomal protection protein [Elusimicrobiota bacterium]